MADAPRYVELHLHTAFSFLDGASLPEEMVARAVELGYTALAVTDHDGLYGAMEFAKSADAAGIFPITGAEVTLADGSHLTLLAETKRGYANLCRLLTEARRLPSDAPTDGGLVTAPVGAIPGVADLLDRGELDPLSDDDQVEYELRGIGPNHRQGRREAIEPRLDPALLARFSEGLILLTGCCKGQLSQLVDADRLDVAANLLQTYIGWFGPNNVVVELQHNLVHGDTERVRHLVALAEQAGLPYAATGNVHYHKPERHRLQDVLVAIRHRTTLDNSHRERRPNAQFHLQDPADVARRFAAYPAALATTVAIAERCVGFNLARDLAYSFPEYPVAEGDSPDALLARVCWDALAIRYPTNQEAARDRLNDELSVISKHGLSGFFLLYRDLLLLAKEVAREIRGTESPRAVGGLPPGRGRGSSVSSIVCYLIGLSHVDPLAHNLFFGRFLNDEMASIPDIDLDFPREIRERLMERVYEVYGSDRAALVCAFSTYKLRSAVRDVGKALGIPMPDLDRIAKMAEPRGADNLGTELARLPGYADRVGVPPWSHLIELASELAGFPRHVTQHVGGMIVSSTPLHELVPLQPASMPGRYICHWDKDSCDDARVVKIDFLALGMLSLVEECLELIAAAGNPTVDLSRINFSDPAIYDMICAGDTIGVFQIESRAQIQMLPKTRPQRLEDLIVQVAIVRPGPIIGGAVAPYVEHRQKQVRGFLNIEPFYDHPLLEPVLEETHGVILYQEQVLQVAMTLAGFSAGQADALRRSMSRKRSRDAMVALWHQFKAGAAERGVSVEIAKTVFKKLLGFAAYGFPKSHAAAFAVLAYQSCWLKHYFPAEFACALLNNQPMGFYPPHVLINDAKRHGIRILPPDINLSGLRCSVEGNGIRIGLGYVDSLGEEAARRIVRERIANAPYASLADFVRRVPLPVEAAENLISVGTFDRFGLGRREALWQLGLFIPPKRVGQKANRSQGRQLSLSLPVVQDTVELSPMRAWDQMAADYAILGLSPRYHPIGLLRPHLPAGLVTTADLEELEDGARVSLAGLTVCRQRPGTAKGIVFLLLEDERGLVNVVVYARLYEERRLVVRGEPFTVVTGILQKRNDTINIVAESFVPLEQARQAFHPAPAEPAPEIGELIVVEDPRQVPHQTATLLPRSHNFR